jgi:co-chaperonin GroES (HSP10)
MAKTETLSIKPLSDRVVVKPAGKDEQKSVVGYHHPGHGR